MIKKIKEKFLNFIIDNDLLRKGEGVVVALSGGPDSVCLLNLLNEIKDEMNIKIVAAHVNHMLRGEAADSDEKYAEDMCKKMGIKFFCKRINVDNYAKEKGLSSETAGREVRYEFFEEVRKKLGFEKVATAHNANDQAETVIMRLMRGTGLEGLAGIPVKRDNIFIRPILFMVREDIEEYCKVHELKPRIDATNLERLYSRNKVRLDILPYMKKNFNEDVVEAINRMTLLIQQDNKYIMEEVDKCYKEKCLVLDEEVVIRKEIFEYNSAVTNRIIRKAIKDVSGSNYDVEMKHIHDVVLLNSLGTNKSIDLPNGLCAKNVYGDIHIKKRIVQEDSVAKEELSFSKQDIIHSENIKFYNYNFKFTVGNKEDMENVLNSKNKIIKYFDFDDINGNIIIRKRRNGDKITPLGMKGNKKLKSLFIDMKIPQEERDLVPIIQFDEDIAWVVPMKMSEKFKVKQSTKKILKIEVL